MSLRREAFPLRSGGFTLIEILVVVLILGLLAGVVGPAVFGHVGRARGTGANAQLEMLAAALDAYRLDNGYYPTTGQGLEALVREPLTDPKPLQWRGPYLRKDVPLDPWGRPYVYRVPAVESPLGYDLLSLGRDGEQGGEGEDADLASWR